MVMDSPSSTALINAGSLFLACATVTFIRQIMAICNGHVNLDPETVKVRQPLMARVKGPAGRY
jgi:hypothetical protein